MQARNIALLAGTAVLLLIATLVVWDLLVVTDEERVEAFADAVTEDVSGENIDIALGYVDPSIQPVIIEVRGDTMRFDQSRAAFDAMARSRLRPYEGTAQHVLRKSIEVGDRGAHVATETFSRQGRVSVDWELKKHQDRWLVSRMAIHR